jgi:uncharacterized heparinase superfamily protein
VPLTDAGRLWRTVRHLRAEQVLGRAWFHLYKPKPDLRPAPPVRARAGTWATPALREPSIVGPQRFRFLGVEHTLGPEPDAWDDPAQERLWRYNLHYFDDLSAAGHTQRTVAHRELVARWIAENPAGRGTGWEPYPLSLRIVNWIKWFLGGAPVQAIWLDSLAAQARWLRDRLEWHLLGNHLFVNAKALVAAGLFFDGREAEDWLARGLAILRRELPEQILPDGGQFERSPMYHALALEDLLDLINLVGARAPADSPARGLAPRLRELASSMLHWLRCMTHPDGGLGLFNDCADGIAPGAAELERYATVLGISSPPPSPNLTHLADSGYIRASRGPAVLLADVAPLGPDYLVGHAHADTLSFELSLGTRRVVVNGGTSCYGLSTQRLRERGTAAHSTVEVAGQNSSEVWSGFRVGRRAHPVGLQVQGMRISCAHDGYRFLLGAPEHRRTWELDDTSLVVADRLSAAGHAAVARYPLAPGLRLQDEGAGEWGVWAGAAPVARVLVTTGRGRQAATQHAQRFGVILPNETLEVDLQDGLAITRWSWNPDAHSISH